MNCSSPSSTERLARSLRRGLSLELYLTPKPGLVDLLDNGSHPDLSLPVMTASIGLMGEYLEAVAAALERGASLPELITLGRRAEERMLRVFGTNTHKGAIFLGGLLLAGCARSAGNDSHSLSRAVAAAAAEFFSGVRPEGTHGQRVREGFRVGGIVDEALAGLPSLFSVVLPAFREGLDFFGEEMSASLLMMGRLMQAVEDTTALHRCGWTGLDRLRRDGRRLEEMILAGDDPFSLLRTLNGEYRRMNLTMGGVADMLGLAFGYLDFVGFPTEAAAEFEVQTSSQGMICQEVNGDEASGFRFCFHLRNLRIKKESHCVSSCLRRSIDVINDLICCGVTHRFLKVIPCNRIRKK